MYEEIITSVISIAISAPIVFTLIYLVKKITDKLIDKTCGLKTRFRKAFIDWSEDINYEENRVLIENLTYRMNTNQDFTIQARFNLIDNPEPNQGENPPNDDNIRIHEKSNEE